MTKHKCLNVGLVGLGGVAQEHLKGCAASDMVNLVAGADINEQRLEDAVQRFGIKPYKDYVEMISHESLDIVCVLTPPAIHRPVVECAANAGVHILCEKPLAPSLSDADAISKSVENAGIKFLFGASYRHLPAMQAARDIIRDGRIGEVRLCYELAIGGIGAGRANALPESHYPLNGPGGTPMGLVDHGVHMIDAFPWLTNSEIVSVWGRGNFTGKDPVPEFATMTLRSGATINLVYDEGTFGLALPGEGAFMEGAGWNVHGYVPPGGFDPFPTTLVVHGSNGALRIYPYANRLYLANTDGLSEINLPRYPKPNHFRAQLETFVDAILKDEPVAATLYDGVRSTQVLLAIYQSAREAKEITLS
ncbi:MAG: Gfo/Idh/MocA family oxidoreductase [Pseudomonadota bacterium]